MKPFLAILFAFCISSGFSQGLTRTDIIGNWTVSEIKLADTNFETEQKKIMENLKNGLKNSKYIFHSDGKFNIQFQNGIPDSLEKVRDPKIRMQYGKILNSSHKDYYRQYVGYIDKDGNRVVFINSGCSATGENKNLDRIWIFVFCHKILFILSVFSSSHKFQYLNCIWFWVLLTSRLLFYTYD
jgi:hypothetical protein